MYNFPRQVQLVVLARAENGSAPRCVEIDKRSKRFVHEVDIGEMDE